ncbi:SDR family NAD(P)-dependent oxidoreductase [Sporolactobacillus laevolacticus]|uniref:Short-chain dehydrogenase n=1 Tax=Sporolactobacillus laevolacticus DSM 442 TaxID=1395513 RepID=V6IUZ6_9BACL|nr:glucose 1-dehydrogenase [Sporolactobacillus laevolacticus]EST10256.1 short-chain dehydrogenase [Sporolactobacillus laevolacticus DSM 442]
MKLLGKTAIVTGGARGIGEAIVREFVAEGAHVVIADLLESGEDLAAELSTEDIKVLYRKTDVSSTDHVKDLVHFALDSLGSIDILVNNAAVNIPGSVVELDEESWDKTMRINVKSQFLMGKYVIPEMQRQGGGVVVNMASANSFVAEPRLSAYVASKGAIHMLTKAMALDYARDHIRVNCICPGWVDTTFNDAHAELYGGREKVLEGLGDVQIIGRPIQPREIARTAVFLASDDSSAFTGGALLADGGITAGI